MNTLTNDPTQNKIWFTSKARMRAESRYRLYDLVSNILIVVLSVIVIGINLFQHYLPWNSPVSEYTIFLAVAILALSILVYGFHFGSTATLHRECYLQLQSLASQNKPPEELTAAYHNILNAYPNHSQYDMDSLILHETFFRSNKLWAANGEPIEWKLYMLVGEVWHFFLIWVLPGVLTAGFIAPLFWL